MYIVVRRLGPYRRFLVSFMVVGTVAGFLVGWLMTGEPLAGLAEAALIAVALGVAFALLARLLSLAPPSSDRARSHRAVNAHTSTCAKAQQDCAKEQSGGNESHDVRSDHDEEERF